MFTPLICEKIIMMMLTCSGLRQYGLNTSAVPAEGLARISRNISSSSCFARSMPLMRLSTASARSVYPFAASQRGLSGTISSPMIRNATGTPWDANIKRHPPPYSEAR